VRTTLNSTRGEQFTLLGEVKRGEALATADVLAGAAVIPLDSTSGYPGVGSVVVEGVVVPYTGLTATTLTGCSGTPAIPAGTPVPYAVDVRSSANASLKFEAKRERDEAAIITKQTGGQGITVPNTAPGHLYNVQIVTGDTNGFTKAEALIWGIWLTESDGDVTLIGDGDWRVGIGPS